MAEAHREQRLQIMMTPAELQAVDDFRYACRMPSRAAAVRELLRRGLAARGYSIADSELKSRDFSVVNSGGEP